LIFFLPSLLFGVCVCCFFFFFFLCWFGGRERFPSFQPEYLDWLYRSALLSSLSRPRQVRLSIGSTPEAFTLLQRPSSAMSIRPLSSFLIAHISKAFLPSEMSPQFRQLFFCYYLSQFFPQNWPYFLFFRKVSVSDGDFMTALWRWSPGRLDSSQFLLTPPSRFFTPLSPRPCLRDFLSAKVTLPTVHT